MAADTETKTSRSSFSMPLAIKFFLGSALLIALAVSAAVVVTYIKGDLIAQNAARDALATSSAAQKEVEQNRLQRLEFTVQEIAADPSLARYVAQAGGATSNLPGLSDSSDT